MDMCVAIWGAAVSDADWAPHWCRNCSAPFQAERASRAGCVNLCVSGSGTSGPCTFELCVSNVKRLERPTRYCTL